MLLLLFAVNWCRKQRRMAVYSTSCWLLFCCLYLGNFSATCYCIAYSTVMKYCNKKWNWAHDRIDLCLVFLCVETDPHRSISCEPEFYWVKPVEYGKWSFALSDNNPTNSPWYKRKISIEIAFDESNGTCTCICGRMRQPEMPENAFATRRIRLFLRIWWSAVVSVIGLSV